MRAIGCLLWGLADFLLLLALLGLLLICILTPCLMVAAVGAEREDARAMAYGIGSLFSYSVLILSAVIAICARVFARRSIVQRALRR